MKKIKPDNIKGWAVYDSQGVLHRIRLTKTEATRDIMNCPWPPAMIVPCEIHFTDDTVIDIWDDKKERLEFLNRKSK